MGIITKLSFKQLQKHLKSKYALRLHDAKVTKSGVSDSVYLLDTDKGAFALKLFESATYEQVAAERGLLSALAALPVSKSFGDISTIDGKPCALYEAAKGSHPSTVTTSHMEEIAAFLSDMHAIAKGLNSTNPPFAAMCAAKKELCVGTPFEPYANLFDEMAALPVDGMIHGDLFPDNIFFDDGKISCVIDFSEAFEGSFGFELGVVAFAFGVEFAHILADTYGGYDEATILCHARHAALFYGVVRFVGGRDYAACLNFLH